MIYLSLVTWNRRSILEQVLDAIERTCPEPHVVLVSDNGSTDGTPEMLGEREQAGLLRAWLLPENAGIARARNVHWAECIGHDTVRLDDKVLFQTAGWLTALQRLGNRYHACVGVPFGTAGTLQVQAMAPLVPFVAIDGDSGLGGPVMFVPGALTSALGAWDELPGLLYGWEDCLFIHRARLLGWEYGLALGVPVEMLAGASAERRAQVQEFWPAVRERLIEYQEGERDVALSCETTEGWQLGQEAKSGQD